MAMVLARGRRQRIARYTAVAVAGVVMATAAAVAEDAGGGRLQGDQLLDRLEADLLAQLTQPTVAQALRLSLLTSSVCVEVVVAS